MKKNILTNTAALIFSLMITLPLLSQQKHLTYEQAYKWGKPRIFGRFPNLRWFEKDKLLKSEFKNGSMQYYTVDAETGKEELFLDLKECKKKLNLPENVSLSRAKWNKDYSAAIITVKGNIYYINREKNIFRQLTSSLSPCKNPMFSPDNKKIAFTRNHNLYVVDVNTGLEKQLTSDGSETVYNGWASWVYYEEVLGRGSRYRAFYFSPDSKKIAFLKFDDSKVPTFTLFKADGVHGELEVAHYPKPGDPNPEVTLYCADIETGKITPIDTKIEDDQYVAWIFWTPDSK